MTAQIVGATDGDPWGPAMWSGSSQRLFTALERRGALAGAVSVRPRPLDYIEKAASYSRDGTAWRQRYRAASSPLSPGIRRTMSLIGSLRAARVERSPDALLQISGWYDASLAMRPRLRCTYQDANLALWLRRPDLAIDPDDPRIAKTLRYERARYERMDLILTMSEWARRSFIEDFGQPPAKVVTVGAGANLDVMPSVPRAREFRVPRLLFVGRKFDRKGGPELLTAFSRLREAHPDATLTIVGPPSRPDAAGVRWLGPIFRDTIEGRNRLEELFSTATTFVMPSLYEGFGIPFVEAMAYALPCVGTSTCAIPEVVVEGETGLLASAGDADSLERVLLKLVSDPTGARAMGERGRAKFLERFTWDHVAGRIVDQITAQLER